MKCQRLIHRLLWLLILICSKPILAQTAFLQPDNIVDGDTTILIVEYEASQVSPDALDISPLATDFEILSTSSSVRIQQTGSGFSNAMRWEIELLPHQSGQLKIPSLSIEGKYTAPLTLTVKINSNSKRAADNDIFIKVSAEPENPYVNQKTNITVKLYYSTRIISGTLSEPGFKSTDIHRLGNDINYTEIIDGKKYEVLERSFAYFPNTNGLLTMLPVVFRGQTEATVTSNNSNYNSYLNPIRMTTKKSNEVKLNVRAKPTSYKGKYWLPANNVRLSEQWVNDQGVKKISDSTSRMIKLIVDGLPSQALPQNLITSTSQINVYPDKPILENQVIGKKMLGKLTQKNTLIFASGGEVTSPQLTIYWWDVDEDIEKQVSLPARQFQVEFQDSNLDSLDKRVPAQASNLTVGSLTDQNTVSHFNFWQALAVGLFGLWLLTLLVWWRSSQYKAKTRQQAPLKLKKWDQKVLRNACKENNAITARKELIAWARARWPKESVLDLAQLIERTSTDEFKAQILELNSVLFSDKVSSKWQGKPLWKAFKSELRSKVVIKAQATGLPPLYPQPISTSSMGRS